jgi:hypothetical protein
MFFDLKIKYMASGIKTRTVWAPCSRLQSRIMAEGKIPRKLGAMFCWLIVKYMAQGF